MIVTLLGTGSPLPDPQRAGPATLVQAGGANILVDCGRGVGMRLAAAGVPGAGFLHQVLLTHLHSDHITDFNDLVTTRWITSMAPSPLPVAGPPGTKDLADLTLAMLHGDVGYRLTHHDDLTWEPSCEVVEVLHGRLPCESLADLGVQVMAAPTDHRPVAPTVGYRITHEGRSVVCAGDTVPCDGLEQLVDGADVYVQTVVRTDLVDAIGLPRLLDVCDYHSSVEQAAMTATRGGVRTLVLTHMVPAPVPGDEQQWGDLAAEHFDGEIVLGVDLERIEV